MNNSQRILLSLLLFTAFFFTILQPIHAEENALPAVTFEYDIIAGEWQRTDGGYVIKISDVQSDGQTKVEYFNPRPVHVVESTISTQKNLLKLFVLFQDKGYEGSTYTLFYFAEKDALVGFYYQAVIDKTYEVIFSRKSY